jgi:sigma-B regulation protein RsbU (phosphoserine phosphatase)
MTDNQACINLFVPFSDKSNRLKGFVGFNMSLKWIDNLLRSSLIYYENDHQAFMFTLTPDGFVINIVGGATKIRKNENLINTAAKVDDAFTSMLYNMRNGETESLKLTSTFLETSNMFFYKSLTNKRISIALSYHENQSLTIWNHQFILILSLLLFFFGIITLWLWWYWKNRAKTVEDMEKCLYAIEQGSTTTVLPSSPLHQDLHELSLKINYMQRGLSLRKQELVSNTRANERSEYERELAKYIRTYFYSPVFQFYYDTLSPKINQSIKADYLSDVGGDFHDYFNISPQHICFVIGTVSRPKKGKSNIQTAVDILMTMNLIRTHLKAYSTLSQSVFYLNNDLCSQNNSNFTVSAFIGVINCETGVLETVSAGVPPPYMIVHRSIISFPVQDGLPLASRPNEKYSTGIKELSNGEMLMVHTEGVLSRQNINSDKYGDIRLRQTMAAISMMNPDMFLEKIAESIADFTRMQTRQVDDYTLLAIKYEEKERIFLKK